MAPIRVIVDGKGCSHNKAAGVALGFLVVASKIPAENKDASLIGLS